MISFSVRLVDEVGRRTCELLGIAGLIICNTVLSFLLSDLEIFGQTCSGFPLGKAGNYAVVVFIFLQTVCFSIGVNSVAWLITPELFRTNTRSKAVFMVTTVNWMANFLVSLGFDLIRDAICGWVFMIFVVFLSLSFVYFYLELPVLDGMSVNETATLFEERAKINRYSRIFKNWCIRDENEENATSS